ncbi:MAG TPA: hypothetical protein VNK04_18055 [Gemmataceae bacterium]|nr:hypothetical protein [Gemmataceae bacterium]
MARIVVCGYMVRHPVAGNLLAYFHYVLGFCRLGHEVAYLEESGWPYSCYDPVSRDWQDFPHTGLRIVRQLMNEHGLHVPVCYVNRDTGEMDGAGRDDLKQMLREADLLLNVGGVCWLPEFGLCRRRALIDLDPLFTQVEHFGARVLPDYHTHFSYGANIGRPGCTIPTRGVCWLPTVPPVVPELWRKRDDPPHPPLSPRGGEGRVRGTGEAFTTVANWSAYGAVTYEGEHYGQKDEEFLRLLDLPRRTPQQLELALAGGHEVRERLRAAGWSVRDAAEVSDCVASYVAYISGSRGEFSAAKHAYVKTRSGWFSDRSVCYLAAGLPVILQDTGFRDWLPVGRGVLAFSSMEEAVASIAKVNADYPAHCRAARELAERVFDYRTVLPRLLERSL